MIVAGIGCSTRAAFEELHRLVGQTAAGRALDAIVGLEARRAQLAPLAEALGLPLITLPRAALQGVATPSHSPRVAEGFGTGSVAEACALLGAGPAARIIVARHVSEVGQATCAVAEGSGQ